jgi:hypothetical protein
MVQSIAASLEGNPSNGVSRTFSPGDTVLGVRLEELLGRGPNGSVWQGRDTTGRSLAVKVAEGSEAAEAAFARGVETIERAASVAGNGALAVPRLHAVAADRLAFVCDHYDNGSALGISALAWDLPRKLAFFAGVCRAVAALHAAGLAHRSLKPSNVLVDDELRPVLADTGMLAARGPGISLDAADVTYQAPEALGGESSASPSADVYGLGRLLWFLLQGSDPDEPYDALATLGALARFPTGIVRIVRKATAHDPAARYQRVEDFEADLARYGDADAVGIGSVPPVEVAPRHRMSRLPSRTAGPPAEARRTPPRAETPRKSRSLARIAGFFGIAATLVAVGVLALTPLATPSLATHLGTIVTFGLAAATLLVPPYAKRPALFRLAAFGAVASLLVALEPERLVLARWRLTLDSGDEQARAQAARFLTRRGHRDLRAVRLGGADLRRADFGRADLRTANLSAANLAGANLEEANLAGAELAGADFSGASLLASSAADAKGWLESRCSRTTSMPAGFRCVDGRPGKARN